MRRLLDAGALVASAFDVVRGEPGERAIRRAIARFERGGALVFADLPGWPRPPAINGFVPAVYAVYEDREVVLILEDAEAWDTEGATRRRLAFAAWAAAEPEREIESVVVSGRRRAPE
ncbi:MAG: hypothetical protein QM820_15360 [Minicystis sp.]